MIREWRMRQFKSVGIPAPLELRPLTIFAGANSSGKSSVLQSMLLISQTLASKVFRRHLVLNGELVKLGTFEDVLNENAADSTIGLGFTLESGLNFTRSASGYPPRFFFPYGPHLEGAKATISIDVTFGPSSEDRESGTAKSGRLQADVLEAHFKARLTPPASGTGSDKDADEMAELVINRLSDEEVRQLLASVTRTEELRSRPVEAEDLEYRAVLLSLA